MIYNNHRIPHLDIQYVFAMNELSTNNGLTLTVKTAYKAVSHFVLVYFITFTVMKFTAPSFF